MKQVLAAKSLLLRGINRTIKRLLFPLLAAVGKASAASSGSSKCFIVQLISFKGKLLAANTSFIH